MVEYALNLDEVFGSLANATRRDMLRQLTKAELSVSQIAHAYNLTFAAVSKHLQVLEKARLITKKRRGNEQVVSISPRTIENADEFLRNYVQMWQSRLDNLDELVMQQASNKKE